MKLAMLGGGGFRTPAIYRALAEGSTRTHYDAVVLYDVDQTRLDRIGAVLAGIDERPGRHVALSTTTNLEEAVDGADVVYCAVRVGGIEGRLLDETAALAEGVIGQETSGAGGITFALRTVPVVVRIAEVVARRAPDALFINFTNPVGLVTEAARRVLGDRASASATRPWPSAGVSPRRWTVTRATSGSTTSGSTTSAGSVAYWTMGATCCPASSRTRSAWPASRRAASSGRTGCSRSG